MRVVGLLATRSMIAGCLLVGNHARAESDELQPLSTSESAALEAVGMLVRASGHPDAADIWPGYDVTKRPLLVYVAERWAVLLNPPRLPARFIAYPGGWPPLGCVAALHPRRFEDLVGQLAFDLQVDSVRTAAIPLSVALFPGSRDSAALACLAFVAHEAFHQYQNERFASVETGSEERYPIEDAENAALVGIEMRVLAEALRATERRDRAELLRSTREFLAVRTHRWRRAPVAMVELERAQELVEGTAKYVEARTVARVGEWCGDDRGRAPFGDLCAGFPRSTPSAYVLEELAHRLRRDALEPEDLPRNRVYGVGAAQALLLDALGVSWKSMAEDSSESFTYAGPLAAAVGASGPADSAWLEHVLTRHGHRALLRASRARAAEFLAGYRAALDAFERQPGMRIRVTLPAQNLTRSRSSAARRWIVNAGDRALSSHYVAYTLRLPGPAGASLRVRDSGVLEEEDRRSGRKSATFFTAAPDTVVIDGKPIDARNDGTYAFESLELSSGASALTCSRPGRLTISGRNVSVELGDRAP